MTTDRMIDAQRALAELAWQLNKEVRSNKLSKRLWMEMYNVGEIQLSSVFENLFVKTRNWMNLKTERASVDGYDFVKVCGNKRIPLGDMKTTTLQRWTISTLYDSQYQEQSWHLVCSWIQYYS